MEKAKMIQQKLDQADEDYQATRVKLSRHFETMDDEKQNFYRYLDTIADQLQAINRRRDDQEVDIRSAYHLLEQAQDEGEQIIKQTNYKLEETLDEAQYYYNKRVNQYEEELQVAKRGAK